MSTKHQRDRTHTRMTPLGATPQPLKTLAGKAVTYRRVNKHDSGVITNALPRPARERREGRLPQETGRPGCLPGPTACPLFPGRPGLRDPDCKGGRRAPGGSGWTGRGSRPGRPGYLHSRCLVHSPLAMGSSWTFYFTSLCTT